VLRIIGKVDKQRLASLPQPVLDDLGSLPSRLLRGWCAASSGHCC
jgi:hypothetical protein